MGLPFWFKISLEFSLVLIGIAAAVYSYFGLLASVIGIVFIANEIGDRNTQRLFFRNQVVGELISILNVSRSPITIVPVIRCPIWGSKPDSEKSGLLGSSDYEALSQFYMRVNARNRLYANSAIDAFVDTHYDESRREIIRALRQLFYTIPWLGAFREGVDWPTE